LVLAMDPGYHWPRGAKIATRAPMLRVVAKHQTLTLSQFTVYPNRVVF